MYWLFLKVPGQLLYMEISFNDFIADQITQFDLLGRIQWLKPILFVLKNQNF